jgi:hypothetical protein
MAGRVGATRRRPEVAADPLLQRLTAFLEAAAILADLRSGDEVIMPSYTLVCRAIGFARGGAVVRRRSPG